MVKNLGGKHNKKIARKSANQFVSERKLRISETSEEIYGVVLKCLGNGQFIITCLDNCERLCVLRNKFTGRNKQGNLLSIGSWVLIGVRNWETITPKKKEKCDLLEIYSNIEKHKLHQECKIDISFLIKQENLILNIDLKEDNDDACNFTFSSLENTSSSNKENDLILNEENESDIDLDEI